MRLGVVGVGVAGILGVGVSGTYAVAQDRGAPTLNGVRETPSLDTRGTVRNPIVDDTDATTVRKPTSVTDDGAQGERRVPTGQDVRAQAPAAPRAVAPSRVMSPDEVKALVADVRACRREVADERRVAVKQVPAGKVLARWTVRPDGTVDAAATEVVAQTSTDPDVLVCVERKVTSARFPPTGTDDDIRLEKSVKF